MIRAGERRACAVCGKPERIWRRLFVWPLGGSVWAFLCSDRCLDDLRDREAA